MKTGLRFLAAFVIFLGLVVGCSSSNNIPEDGGISGTGVGVLDTGGMDPTNPDSGVGDTSGQQSVAGSPGPETVGTVTDMDAGTDSSSFESEVDSDTGVVEEVGTEAGGVDAGTDDSGALTNTIDLNGDYDITVLLSEASLAVPECEEAEGILNVTGTTITGIVDDVFTVTGSISSDGTISGGFALEDGNPFAVYDGMLDGEDLVGTWADLRGCGGTWRAVKVIAE